MITPEECHIGRGYGLKQEDRYFWVTLMSIDESAIPPLAHVLIREHSIDSYISGSSVRKRHKTRGEAVPCVTVPLTDLFALTKKQTVPPTIS